MNGFVVNRAGRIVFPCNFFPNLDFSVFDTLERFEAVIKRDFEAKAPSDAEIVRRATSGHYGGRYELLRDIASHLFWANRYALTMYHRRPTRWRDVPRHRSDLFLCPLSPGDRLATTTVIEAAYRALPATWDATSEQVIFGLLFDIFRTTPGTELQAWNPSVTEAVADRRTVYQLAPYDRDYPVYSRDDIIEYGHRAAPLEALMRQAMVLHNLYPWDREHARARPVAELEADDVVIVLHPRNDDVLDFLRRVRRRPAAAGVRPRPISARPRSRPCPPVEIRRRFTVTPRLEAMATFRGERVVTNEDLIRNAAYCWSPMTADEIREKTGIAERRYTELDLDDMALLAAQSALGKAGRRPEEIGAVVFCSCTSSRAMPSVATRLSARLGMFQTHASYDLVAACAALPYGLSEAIRILEEIQRPVLVVGAEKFSDKIGAVRASRMLFGDGAAALVLAPAPEGEMPDIDVVQTYASGPLSEVESIVWPNPDFNNSVTVYGPDVRALVKRYLEQMVGEIAALPHPDGRGGSLMDAIDLVVPHQANKPMVTSLAKAAGIAPDRLYFNIDRVGNTSAASIGLAIEDAVRDGIIDRPRRVFTPAFGAGAVAGYAVMRVDPAVVAEGARARGFATDAGQAHVPYHVAV